MHCHAFSNMEDNHCCNDAASRMRTSHSRVQESDPGPLNASPGHIVALRHELNTPLCLSRQLRYLCASRTTQEQAYAQISN